jgi:hypothetical protein
MRTHSLAERNQDQQHCQFLTGFGVIMFWIPMVVLERLKDIYIDGIVNGVDVRDFVDEFTTQTKSQATVVSTIL